MSAFGDLDFDLREAAGGRRQAAGGRRQAAVTILAAFGIADVYVLEVSTST